MPQYEFSRPEITSYTDWVRQFNPLHVIKEPLIYSGDNVTELYKRGDVAGADVHWGDMITSAQAMRQVAEAFGYGDEWISKTAKSGIGFDVLFRSPWRLSPQEAVEQELKLVHETIKRTLDLKGWLAKDVKNLYVGSGTPPIYNHDLRYANYARTIAKMCQMDPAVLDNTYAYCNSGGRAFRKSLDGEGNTLVAAIDNLTHLAANPDNIELQKRNSEVDPRITDEYSPLMFSSGMAILAYNPKKDFIKTVEVHDEQQDLVKGLPVRSPYQDLLDPNNPNFYQVRGNMEMLAPSDPATEQYPLRVVNMAPARVARLFLNNAALPGLSLTGLDQFNQMFSNNYPDEIVYPDYVIFHGANEHIIYNLEHLLNKKYKDLKFHWKMRDGNTSGAMTVSRFVRELNNPAFASGKQIMIISFGAGASYDIFFITVGDSFT